MFKITQRGNLWNSNSCQACMAGYGTFSLCDCDSCKNHVITSYKCPRCTTTRAFRAYDAPVICETCQIILPNIRLLLHAQLNRIDYHLSPVVIDVQPEAIDVQSY